jgi:hypothetical protein
MKRTTLLVTVGVSVLALLAVVVRKGGGMIVIPNRVRVVVVMVSALALAAGLLTLALLEKPAQAQAETIMSNDRSTFNLLSGTCGDELAQIQGTLHTVAHTTIDATGVRHIRGHFNEQGQGEGTISGDKYVFHDVFNLRENLSGDDPGDHLTFTVTETAELIRQGSTTPTDDQRVKSLVHVTINANGEVTADVVKIEFECT